MTAAPTPAPQPRPAPRPVTGDRSAARTVVTAEQVGRVVDRMAHELLESAGGVTDVVLLGIPTRGVALARRLADRVGVFSGEHVPVGALDVTLYRDDLRLKGPRALASTELPPDGIDGRRVVLVDDVLFTGRSVRAALDALADLGRPRAVELLVLVDRGHRELPIRADHVGRNVATTLTETIHVLLTETDGEDGVLLGPADLGKAETGQADSVHDRE